MWRPAAATTEHVKAHFIVDAAIQMAYTSGDRGARLRVGRRAGAACGEGPGNLLSDRCAGQVRDHPVAGRMPGHRTCCWPRPKSTTTRMKDMEDINDESARTDVLASRDRRQRRHQPGAQRDVQPGIYGMPILNVDKSRRR